MKRLLRKLFFYACLLIMGAAIIESDIIMGHHEAERLRTAAVHYVEEPKERIEDDSEPQ